MKILLVNCINLDEGLRYTEDSAEHLGILYIASSLRRHFTEKELEIKVTYGPVFSSTLDDIKPYIVGLSSVSQNYHIAQRYAKLCKERSIPVVVGGVHISTLPNTLTEDMNVGIINEGEDAIVELMRIFMEDSFLAKQKLADVKGIVYHDKSGLSMTPFRERIKNLDTLPIPARELYYHPRRGIFTSRGCPYDCIFCFSKPFWGAKARFFSPEYVVKEIVHIVERFNVSQLSIYDDLFIAPRARFKKIVELIREAGLHKKITFNCNVRPNEITEEVAELLKSMNITHVFLGIESGNQRVLKYLKKQACSVEQNSNAIRILKKQDILTHGGFIIGSPDETKEEIMDTYRFIRKSCIDSFSPLMLTPLPGTPVWEIAKKRGLVTDFMDWSILREEFNEVENRHIIMSETLSRKELSKLYRKFKRLQKRKYFYLALKHPFIGIREVSRLVKRQVNSWFPLYF
ncbi:MAG: radical SAM protein [Deltaproteobacteria bacterium]|nr:radical SAM protein [Deltaproteobacteria bacterium]